MGTVVFQVPIQGKWTVRGEFGEQIKTKDVILSETEKNVLVSLEFDTAILNVTSPVGTQLTLTNGMIRIEAVSSTGINRFTLSKMGEWNIEGVLEGFTILPTTVNVLSAGEYHVELKIATVTLIVTAQSALPVGVFGLSDETIGKYAIFAGGQGTSSGSGYQKIVCAYTLK